MTTQPQAPDIGTVFTYHDRRYMVQSWLKVAPPPQIPDDADDLMRELFEEMDAEAEAEGTKTVRMMWCSREEATHVAGRGVGGCIAPIGEITVVTDAPQMPAEHLADLRDSAERKIGRLAL